jgi:hypothetical protein
MIDFEPHVEDKVLRIKHLMQELNNLSKELADHHIEVRIEPERVQVADLGGPVQVVRYWSIIKVLL